ncbi:MAG TPA: hypothetical protein VLJ37_05845 [bacterium]|nr:hypothetical protein [bacterium]
MLDRKRIVASFEQALVALKAGPRKDSLSPRAVAVRAHEIYRSGAAPGENPSSWETFRRFTAGRLAIPEVVELLNAAGIRSAARARLDRQKLRHVFEEAIQRMEARLVKGQAKPLQIARRAYAIYTQDAADHLTQPSHHTFERLIYGKTADPEILTLIESASKRKDDSR